MVDDELLTLSEGARLLRLASAETFARFCAQHSIPVVRFSSRVVRVRASDLRRAIADHTDDRAHRPIDAGAEQMLASAF